MKCKKCGNKAVISEPPLCKEHFIIYYEKKVSDTIKKYDLIRKGDNICVAASGGKDSTSALFLMKKLFRPEKGQLKALLIDEGISGYRDNTITDLKKFCKANKIPLKIISFKDEFGKTLDKIIASGKIGLKPCTICGTLRRYLLNKHARGFDVIVTGHNLDDECQAVLMNLMRQQTDLLARAGPASGTTKRGSFVQRVKPLYECTEKETALYALLQGFDISFNECPNIVDSYRADVRALLNDHESKHKGTKKGIITSFISSYRILTDRAPIKGPNPCKSCGEPSSGDECSTCKLLAMLRS